MILNSFFKLINKTVLVLSKQHKNKQNNLIKKSVAIYNDEEEQMKCINIIMSQGISRIFSLLIANTLK